MVGASRFRVCPNRWLPLRPTGPRTRRAKAAPGPVLESCLQHSRCHTSVEFAVQWNLRGFAHSRRHGWLRPRRARPQGVGPRPSGRRPSPLWTAATTNGFRLLCRAFARHAACLGIWGVARFAGRRSIRSPTLQDNNNNNNNDNNKNNNNDSNSNYNNEKT